eukprot:4805919-Prymnesium_polylepis.1
MNSPTPALQPANDGSGSLLNCNGGPSRRAREMAVSPQPYGMPPMIQRRNSMWFDVRVCHVRTGVNMNMLCHVLLHIDAAHATVHMLLCMS